MQVSFGNGRSEHGPGVQVDLTGNEVATAILAYLTAHSVHITGAMTITVNGRLCKDGSIYVDPAGAVIHGGKRWTGRGHIEP